MAATDNFDTAITNVSNLILSITANPKPSYSVGGVNISWTEYLQMLTSQLEALQKARAVEYGPYELVTQGWT